MKDLTKYFIDLSKCTDEQQKHIFSLLPKAEFDNQYRIDDRHFRLSFDENDLWWVYNDKKDVNKTELTYHEFIKLFEGGDGENNTYSFSYLSCGKTLTVHIEAKNFNKAMIEFATNYHDIEWLYDAKIL